MYTDSIAGGRVGRQAGRKAVMINEYDLQNNPPFQKRKHKFILLTVDEKAVLCYAIM